MADNQYFQFLLGLQEWRTSAKIALLITVTVSAAVFLWWPQIQNIVTAKGATTVATLPPGVVVPAPAAAAGALSWDDHWGTTTEAKEGTVYLHALQIRARNASDHDVHLKDAHVQSGQSGQELKMKADAGSAGWLPADQVNPVPSGATITFRVEFNPPHGLSPKEFMLEWGNMTLVALYDDEQHRRSFAASEMERIFQAFGINPLGPNVTKRTDSQHK